MVKDINESKRNVQRIAEKKFRTKFNVICTATSFSYITNTQIYCQFSNLDLTCYAFSAI